MASHSSCFKSYTFHKIYPGLYLCIAYPNTHYVYLLLSLKVLSEHLKCMLLFSINLCHASIITLHTLVIFLEKLFLGQVIFFSVLLELRTVYFLCVYSFKCICLLLITIEFFHSDLCVSVKTLGIKRYIWVEYCILSGNIVPGTQELFKHAYRRVVVSLHVDY